MKKRTLRLVLALALALSMLLCSCGSMLGVLHDTQVAPDSAEAPSGSAEAPSDSVEVDGEEAATPPPRFTRGTQLSLREDKELNITRNLDNIQPVEGPADGIWTVFVYMCGANLESKNGCATLDLSEMQAATSAAPNLRFVVLAGGANGWMNDFCSPYGNTALLISGGEITSQEDGEANMGDPNTLYDFLSWALESYTSQYNVLEFWDHGGGSTGGVCYDERYGNDSLSLLEIDNTLAALYQTYAVKFDLIGCDACLMATGEMANILVPYADYLVASEESEPGTGWYYAGFSDGVNAGVTNGGELGMYICDAYAYSLPGNQSVTLSVMDLAAIDAFLRSFNIYCMDVYDYICAGDGLYDLVRAAKNLPAFGGGDFNITDLGLLVEATAAYSPESAQVLALIDNCVVYMVNCESYQDVSGMAVYFPLIAAEGSQHINSLKNLCVNPYYLGIVDVCAYGKAAAGDISGYDQDHWVGEDSTYWSEDEEEDPADYTYMEDPLKGRLNFDLDYAQVLFSELPHREDPLVGFDKYCFTLSDLGLKNVDVVYTSTFLPIETEDGEKIWMDFGADYVASGDYYRYNDERTQELAYAFDNCGFHTGLTLSQPLSIHPITRRYVEGYGYVNYFYAPVSVNGVEKNLLFYEYYDQEYEENWIPNAPQVFAVGFTDININMASRIEPLKQGDELLPLYPSYYADTMEFFGYRVKTGSEPYVCEADGDFRLVWQAWLPNADYRLSYMITDVYGNTLYTPTVGITLDRVNHTFAIMTD